MKTLLCFLFPAITLGQAAYKGNIVNKKTNEKVSFATVGLVIENIGTNADEDGKFVLTAKAGNPNDTMTISCVGYETLKIAVSKLPGIIELEERQTMLANFSITSKVKCVYIKLNDSECGNVSITTRGFQTHVARLFTTTSDNAILTEVEVCKSNPIFENHKTIFRLRFYDMDTITKAPSTELCNEIIEVKTSSKTTNVNVEKYKISIPNKNFFVAVEWLKIPYNENVEKVTSDGKKEVRVTYRPNISCTNALHGNNHREVREYAVWGLGYQNKWFPMVFIKDISISATIKY